MRYIAGSSNAAVTGITETKLDNTVYNSEVAVDEFNKGRNDSNRNGGGCSCYIKNKLCYNRKACIPNNKGKMLIDILSPKTKLILVDITCKPPESNPILRTNG